MASGASKVHRDSITAGFRGRSLLGTAVAALVLAYLAVGLYPYRWAPPVAVPNTAELIQEGGLAFRVPGPGIARTEKSPDWVAEAIAEDRITVELSVRSSSREQVGPARILSLSADHHHRNLTIAQDGVDLVVRLRTPESDANGEPATRVPDVFAATKWRSLRVAVVPSNLEIAVDGETVVRKAIPKRPLRDWSRSFRLALGNELTNDRTWLGEIDRAVVRVGSREIDYSKPGLLTLPATLWVFDQPPRLTPMHGLEAVDAVINLIGFVPLGILLFTSLGPRRRMAYGLAVIVLTSATIEGLQFVVPGRVPAVDDILLNTAGGVIGLLIGGRLRGHRALPH